MTPFDPSALLAVLLAFYQPATPANLARAFQERPDYFAGGQLIGSKANKLQLPDGEVWQLIGATDDPINAHYEAVQGGSGGGSAGDPLFALTPGALAPAPADVMPMHPAGSVFVPIVGDSLGDLNAADTAIGTNQQTITEANTIPDALDGSGADVDAAGGAIADHVSAIQAAAPDDVLYNTDQHAQTIPAHSAVYDEPPPNYADTGTVPPPPPETPDTQHGGGGTEPEGAAGNSGGGQSTSAPPPPPPPPPPPDNAPPNDNPPPPDQMGG